MFSTAPLWRQFIIEEGYKKEIETFLTIDIEASFNWTSLYKGVIKFDTIMWECGLLCHHINIIVPYNHQRYRIDTCFEDLCKQVHSKCPVFYSKMKYKVFQKGGGQCTTG